MHDELPWRFPRYDRRSSSSNRREKGANAQLGIVPPTRPSPPPRADGPTHVWVDGTTKAHLHILPWAQPTKYMVIISSDSNLNELFLHFSGFMWELQKKIFQQKCELGKIGR